MPRSNNHSGSMNGGSAQSTRSVGGMLPCATMSSPNRMWVDASASAKTAASKRRRVNSAKETANTAQALDRPTPALHVGPLYRRSASLGKVRVCSAVPTDHALSRLPTLEGQQGRGQHHDPEGQRRHPRRRQRRPLSALLLSGRVRGCAPRHHRRARDDRRHHQPPQTPHHHPSIHSTRPGRQSWQRSTPTAPSGASTPSRVRISGPWRGSQSSRL